MASESPRKKRRIVTGGTVVIPYHRNFHGLYLKSIHRMQVKIDLVVQEIEKENVLEEAFYEPSRHPDLCNLGSKRTTKQRTTFFSLPRELGQPILT